MLFKNNSRFFINQNVWIQLLSFPHYFIIKCFQPFLGFMRDTVQTAATH